MGAALYSATANLLLGVAGAGAIILFIQALTQRMRGRVQAGIRGEVAVARMLSRVPDAVIFHDVMLGKENADHVVLTRQGVFSIETKNLARLTATKKGLFAWGRNKNNVTKQAKRQAGKLARELRVKVTPIAVFVHPTTRLRIRSWEGVELATRRNLLKTITRLRRENDELDDKYLTKIYRRMLALTGETLASPHTKQQAQVKERRR